MNRDSERNRLLKKRRMLELSKRSPNPAFKVIDKETGCASSFYSSTFAIEEAKEKARQGQQAFARRRIRLKNNPED